MTRIKQCVVVQQRTNFARTPKTCTNDRVTVRTNDERRTESEWEKKSRKSQVTKKKWQKMTMGFTFLHTTIIIERTRSKHASRESRRLKTANDSAVSNETFELITNHYSGLPFAGLYATPRQFFETFCAVQDRSKYCADSTRFRRVVSGLPSFFHTCLTKRKAILTSQENLLWHYGTESIFLIRKTEK